MLACVQLIILDAKIRFILTRPFLNGFYILLEYTRALVSLLNINSKNLI